MKEIPKKTKLATNQLSQIIGVISLKDEWNSALIDPYSKLYIDRFNSDAQSSSNCIFTLSSTGFSTPCCLAIFSIISLASCYRPWIRRYLGLSSRMRNDPSMIRKLGIVLSTSNSLQLPDFKLSRVKNARRHTSSSPKV